MAKDYYVYELRIKNEFEQEEKVKIISDLNEETLRRILNYDVELIGKKPYQGKII